MPPKNMITSENAIQEPGEPEAERPIVGQVVRKGAPPPSVASREPEEDVVMVRITKAGHGAVHTGNDEADAAKFYDWNDEVPLPRSVGEALERRHYAEILPGQ